MGNLSGGKMLRKRQRAADLIGRLVHAARKSHADLYRTSSPRNTLL